VARVPPFERRDVLLEGGTRAVLHPRVLVALVDPELVVDVGRGGVDRDGDGAGRRVGLLAGVDGAGGKAEVPRVPFHGCAIG